MGKHRKHKHKHHHHRRIEQYEVSEPCIPEWILQEDECGNLREINTRPFFLPIPEREVIKTSVTYDNPGGGYTTALSELDLRVY